MKLNPQDACEKTGMEIEKLDNVDLVVSEGILRNCVDSILEGNNNRLLILGCSNIDISSTSTASSFSLNDIVLYSLKERETSFFAQSSEYLLANKPEGFFKFKCEDYITISIKYLPSENKSSISFFNKDTKENILISSNLKDSIYFIKGL